MNSTISKRIAAIFDGKGNVLPQDRLYLLALLGIAQQDIARELGVSHVTVHQTITDKCSSLNIATKIAEMTGVPLSKLWPDGRYNRPPHYIYRKQAA